MATNQTTQLSKETNPDHSTVSGLFLYRNVFLRRSDKTKPKEFFELEFIPLSNHKIPIDENDDTHFKALTVNPGLSGIRILNSCHGLLCCLGYDHIKHAEYYHVLNPTTKQSTTLPEPHLPGLEGLTLAFNPSKSPHYKVVSVWSSSRIVSIKAPYVHDCYYQIEIYSSETGSWRASGEPFTVSAFQLGIQEGVYWNGAIHWFCDGGDALYFNVDQEYLGTMPMPPIPEGKEYYDRASRYAWESRDHLHMIDIYDGAYNRFNVYEMARDYSEWFVKYQVDLDAVGAAFPKMIEILSGNKPFQAYNILTLVREENDEDSFMVLHMPDGKIIQYNLVDKSFKTIYDEGLIEDPLSDLSWRAQHYIKSYACV
ncbi:hypothetical protein ACSBR1_039914 [Camellia fascicularis]